MKPLNSSLLLFIIFFLGCQPIKNANTNSNTNSNSNSNSSSNSTANTEVDGAEATFPESWEGSWEGTLEIFNAKGKTMEVYMGLEIHPIDTSDNHTWSIIYGEGEQQQVRAYELIPKDPAKGHYVTDEKNSILLDDYYYGNTLYSRFEVMGSLLLAMYTKEGETIRFQIISGKVEPINETGGKTIEGEEIPKVNSYGINVGQRAILRRKQ